ncbi:hypothetical protein MN0502_14160 [Arthrobacter sp. MN05-02]|nr:hypothetical protein MN0502_14160 [Arthrobacter sp. MN05-02]
MTDAVPAADPAENPDGTAGSTAGTAELTVERPAHGGHFVARHEGRVVFVRHALPGEVVRVRFTDTDEDASFWRADVAEVIEPSPHRVTHPWPLADALAAAAKGRSAVGGAEFGHIALDEQRRLKGAIFEEQLTRLAKTDRAVTVEAAPGEAADGLAWRTRAAFAVDSAGRLAMHLHRSHDVVPVREMPLAVAAVNDLRLWALDLTGIGRVDVAVPSGGGRAARAARSSGGHVPAPGRFGGLVRPRRLRGRPRSRVRAGRAAEGEDLAPGERPRHRLQGHGGRFLADPPGRSRGAGVRGARWTAPGAG